MESHKPGFPAFPHSLEISSGLQQFNGVDGDHTYRKTTPEEVRKLQNWALARKGVVADVPGPKCNGCSSTLSRRPVIEDFVQRETVE